MKKNHSTCFLLQVILVTSSILISANAISQDLTDEQKKERCQTNKNRIKELEIEIGAANARLRSILTEEEMETVREQLSFLKLRKPGSNLSEEQRKKWMEILEYNNGEYSEIVKDCLAKYNGDKPGVINIVITNSTILLQKKSTILFRFKKKPASSWINIRIWISC